jgi:hypothetical protein
MGTLRGWVVSEGGPRPSIVFVHDDPRLCVAVQWWRELARASAVLLVPFAALGALATHVDGASLVRYAAWLAVAAAAGVVLRLAWSVSMSARVEYRPMEAGAETAPPQRLSLRRLAVVLISRIGPAVAAIAIAGGARGAGSLVLAVAWGPAVTAAWTAATAGSVVAFTSRWERRRRLRLHFPAGARQRAAAPYVLYTTPR